LGDNATGDFPGETASNAVQQAGNDPSSLQSVVAEFTGTNLNNLITAASGQVGSADDDAGEQAALKLTLDATEIGSAAAALVPFTTAGLDLEDTGTVTFTDVNGKTVQVSVNGSQTSYTANLRSLADGMITSKLLVDADPAGNSFTAVAGDSVSLETIPPTVSISTSGGLTNQASQTIYGTVTTSEAPVGATVSLYDNGGATAIGTATVGTGGAWSTPVTLSGDGTHSIVAQDTDAAGNTGTSSAVVFTLDTDATE
jgi:hypothetical protein